MATQVKHRRGNSSEINAAIPAVGEFWYNTDDGTIHAGDGVTLGGTKHITHSSGFTVFATLADAQANPSAVECNSVFILEIETGKGGEVIADYVTGQAANDMDIFDHNTLPLQIKFKPRDKKTSIGFVFDDEWLNFYNVVLPEFESRDFPMSIAVNHEFLRDGRGGADRMSVSELIDAQLRGVEILNHGTSHRNMSAENSVLSAKGEIDTCLQYLVDHGCNVNGFVAANSALSDDVISIPKSNHSYAFTVNANNDPDLYEITPDSDAYRLGRIVMDGVPSSQTIDKIKDLIKYGKGAVLYDHDIAAASSDYNNLVSVLNFIQTIPDLIDVKLPVDVVSGYTGSMSKLKSKGGELIHFGVDGKWTATGNLTVVQSELTMSVSPTAVSSGETIILDTFEVKEDALYTFSANVRGETADVNVLMEAQCLDEFDAVITDGTVKSDSIVNMDNSQYPRHYININTLPGTKKLKVFFRINVLAAGGVFYIQHPQVVKGDNILKSDLTFAFPELLLNVTTAANFTPKFIRGSENKYSLNITAANVTLNAPTGDTPETKDLMTFYLFNSFNGPTSMALDTEYNGESIVPIFNKSAIIKFEYFRGKWKQVSSQLWI